MEYTKDHASRALAIVDRWLPSVSPRGEYRELRAILAEPNRWKEAHDCFSAIRTRITLPLEKKGERTLEYLFAFVAENAAKTAYNCSNEPAPFDEDSFHWLLRCEREFADAVRIGTKAI